MTLSESKVLEKLNAVSTAKRLANMVSCQRRLQGVCREYLSMYHQELHDSEFGRREEIHKVKAAKRRMQMTTSS